MGIQYGMWNFDRAGIAPTDLTILRAALEVDEADPFFEHSEREMQIFVLPLHFTPDSEKEDLPLPLKSGQVLVWDGRLDNRQELIASLGMEIGKNPTDAAIVAMAMEIWGIASLAKFLGDWALSVWDPRERTVLLARDFLGARPLYYTIDESFFAWSTRMEPLLRLRNQAFQFQEEYLAGWFSHFPSANLTPFAGIQSVPPASYVSFCPRKSIVQRYWSFDPHKKIRYHNDRGYEDHFRTLFEQSVRRRLRSTAPVLAELSGGMDSSSIVCMADQVLLQGGVETPRLDTISYYDDSEPNWNESAYFQVVERKRGRAGLHLPVNSGNTLRPHFPTDRFAPTPGSVDSLDGNEQYRAYLCAGQYRVLLQGLGGDEVLGGIPMPSPELGDLLLSGQLRSLASSFMAWSLTGRVPVFRLVIDMFRECFLQGCTPAPTPWLQRGFVRRNRGALLDYRPSQHTRATRPSFRANLHALEYLRGHVSCLAASANNTLERRFVYLDRDLLEFLYGVPREQLLRPGQRRSLMRRALRGIVPDEILQRKRKAFISRGPIVAVQAELNRLLIETEHMVLNDMGIVDSRRFQVHLKRAAEGQSQPIVPLLRTLLLEAWLRHASHWKSIRNSSLGPLADLHAEAYSPHGASQSLS